MQTGTWCFLERTLQAGSAPWFTGTNAKLPLFNSYSELQDGTSSALTRGPAPKSLCRYTGHQGHQTSPAPGKAHVLSMGTWQRVWQEDA